MLMQQSKIKPAVVLDDDRDWATNISRSIRRFGGLPVKYFPSVESFYRHHEIEYGDKIGLAKVLEGYSVVVSDNNFESADNQTSGDGEIRGANFLLGQLGPALQEMSKENRPLVLCFAPSSQSVLAQREQEMWDKYGIVSFHKTWETAAVGLTVRIAREYGVSLSRKSIITNICQQSLDEDEYESPKAQFFFWFRADHTDFEDFPKEKMDQPEGEAKPMKWNEIVSALAKKLNIDDETLSATIKHEVEIRKSQIEGQKGGSPEKK